MLILFSCCKLRAISFSQIASIKVSFCDVCILCLGVWERGETFIYS